jgi:hypothetical protein
LKLIPMLPKTFRNEPPQDGHSVSASSVNDCCTSKACSQSRHL